MPPDLGLSHCLSAYMLATPHPIICLAAIFSCAHMPTMLHRTLLCWFCCAVLCCPGLCCAVLKCPLHCPLNHTGLCCAVLSCAVLTCWHCLCANSAGRQLSQARPLELSQLRSLGEFPRRTAASQRQPTGAPLQLDPLHHLRGRWAQQHFAEQQCIGVLREHRG